MQGKNGCSIAVYKMAALLQSGADGIRNAVNQSRAWYEFFNQLALGCWMRAFAFALRSGEHIKLLPLYIDTVDKRLITVTRK